METESMLGSQLTPDDNEKQTIVGMTRSQESKGMPGTRGGTTAEQEVLVHGMAGRILSGIRAMTAAFFLYYAAYIGLVVIQSSIVGPIGTIGMGLNFVASILGCVGLAPLMVSLLGCKTCIVFGGVSFWLWMLANFYPTWYTVWPVSFLSGLAIGPLFTAQGHYFSVNGRKYARITGQNEDTVISRFFGIFFCLLYLGTSVGCVLTSLVLEFWTDDSQSVGGEQAAYTISSNETVNHIRCGSKYCPMVANPAADDHTASLLSSEPHAALTPQFICLVAVHSSIMLLSLIIMVVAIESTAASTSASTAWNAAKQSAIDTGRHLMQARMLCLTPINLFAGCSQSFLLADFTEAYVACSVGAGVIGYVLALWGLGACLASIICGFLEPKTGRVPIFTTVFFIRLVVVMFLSFWIPDTQHLYLLFVLTFLWATGDGALISQLNSMYGMVFRETAAVAFSSYRLYEAVGLALGYSLNPVLCTRYKLALLLLLGLLAIMGYYLTEHLHVSRNRPALPGETCNTNDQDDHDDEDRLDTREI